MKIIVAFLILFTVLVGYVLFSDVHCVYDGSFQETIQSFYCSR